LSVTIREDRGLGAFSQGMLLNNQGLRFQVPGFGCQPFGMTNDKWRMTNIEQGIMNIDVRYSIIIIFLKD
jgi:hypothetical protein